MLSNVRPRKAILVLEDKTIYKGWSFGQPATIFGEVVFTTGMTGYQEVVTDPSYLGQIVVFTYPEIGNTGINSEDDESFKIQCKGLIVRNLCTHHSSWRSKTSLLNATSQSDVPIFYGMDTRKLTKHLRTVGALNGCLSSEEVNPQKLLDKLQESPRMAGLDLVARVTTEHDYIWEKAHTVDWHPIFFPKIPLFNKSTRIVVLDFGIKLNILRYLSSQGCMVIVVPASSSAKDILAHNPSGIMLSNGPGDPGAVTYAVETIKQLIDSRVPMFGICMGHQILGLAFGGEAFKLKFGHRGINHPIGLLQKADITTQNHGFAIQMDSRLEQCIKISHYNLNDWTVAGLIHKDLPIFSVQYHPEASPGPHDTDYFFNIFFQTVAQNSK